MWMDWTASGLQIVPDLFDSGNDSYYGPAPCTKKKLFFHHQHHWDCSKGKKCIISTRHEPISILFCGCGCQSVLSWRLTYMSVVMWNVQRVCLTSLDSVSVAVFVLPYFPVGVFPFRVVSVRVYTLGLEPLTLLESSLKLYFMMLLDT
jgi:hypothetical protein